jgi:OPA family glycerol-3-phosphate transporter-like MFS transporter
MIGLLKPAPHAARLLADRVSPGCRRLRRQVLACIFTGHADSYLVGNNLALVIPDILKEHPEFSKAMLGTALTGLLPAYGALKFRMGSVSAKSNPRYFLLLGLLLSCAILAVCGLVKAVFASLLVLIALGGAGRR